MYQSRLEAAGSIELNRPHSADTESIMDAIEPCLEDLDPGLMESFQYLRRNHVYDIDDSDTKNDKGYTQSLPQYGSAMIFNRAKGNELDYSTMIHEFGHFNAVFHDDQDILFSETSLDVQEIHSQGLELLCHEYYDDFFEEDADALRDIAILSMLDSVISGCMYDEFQRNVYANPEMTAEELNALALRLSREYGRESDDAEPEESAEYKWVMNRHNFDSPLYYISYAVSALTAFDLYLDAMEDRDAAADKYMKLTALGCEIQYRKAMKEIGLPDVFDSGIVRSIAERI